MRNRQAEALSRLFLSDNGIFKVETKPYLLGKKLYETVEKGQWLDLGKNEPEFKVWEDGRIIADAKWGIIDNTHIIDIKKRKKRTKIKSLKNFSIQLRLASFSKIFYGHIALSRKDNILEIYSSGQLSGYGELYRYKKGFALYIRDWK